MLEDWKIIYCSHWTHFIESITKTIHISLIEAIEQQFNKRKFMDIEKMYSYDLKFFLPNGINSIFFPKKNVFAHIRWKLKSNKERELKKIGSIPNKIQF